MSRDVLVRITEDSQRKATWIEVVLPEFEEEGKTIIPDFSVFPEKNRATVTFYTYNLKVRVKRVPELTYSAVDEEGEYDKWAQMDIQNWFELIDKETPEPWRPASWMPWFVRWGDGRGRETYGYEVYPVGADPRDPTQVLYVYDPDAAHPPIKVEPWTLHLPAEWIRRKTYTDRASLDYEPEDGGWDAGFWNVFWNSYRRDVFWNVDRRAEAKVAEQDAEHETQKGLDEAEAEARDRAEEEAERKGEP